MTLSIQEILAGGADVAIILFAWFLFKIERRLFIVETQIKAMCMPEEEEA
jgi:hypothetical protein